MHSSTVAIVQPYEYVSVAEQRGVLRQYARTHGVSIDRFVGDDCFLQKESPVLSRLLESVANGMTGRILLLNAIKEKLPQGFCETARALGSDVRVIDYHKSVLVGL